MIELLIIITLSVLVVASYNDFLTREIPDWLNYSLIASALGIRMIYSIQLGWNIFLSGILGLAVAFALACLFYYSHQWGGGDSKLLMGMGAVIGITYPFEARSWELLWFFVALMLLGALYGLLWMVFLAIKNRHQFNEEFLKELKHNRGLHWGMWGASIAIMITGFFLHFMLLLSVVPIGLLYLLLFVNVVEKSCFIKKSEVIKLTEGDWLAENVLSQGKVILPKKTLNLEDLQKLRENKIKTVIIKEGIPFTPGFLLAYLTILWGQELILSPIMTLF